MLAIRGVYDGKTFRVVPTESLPTVHREVPVVILFLEEVSAQVEGRQHQVEIANRMRAAREAMLPLSMSVKDLVEKGRER